MRLKNTLYDGLFSLIFAVFMRRRLIPLSAAGGLRGASFPFDIQIYGPRGGQPRHINMKGK